MRPVVHDLVIRGGTVVTGGGTHETDIWVRDGVIDQLGGSGRAGREIDATSRWVLPGGIDPHVHLTPPSSREGGWTWVDDFRSGTEAALAGGVTTVGNITFPDPGSDMRTALERDEAVAAELSLCDTFLHPVLLDADDTNLDQIAGLQSDGYTSLKIFLSFHRFDRQVGRYLDAMRRVAAAGGVALVHCEDAAIMSCCCEILREEGRTGVEFYPEARPVRAEAVATHRAIAFGETTGCPVYVVHLASSEALFACRDARSRGVPVHVETRPLYLHLTRERFLDPDGAKYSGAPPLREQFDRDALWSGIGSGDVEVVATDHAPWTLEQKLDPATDATDLRQGVSDLETCLPMLWSEGVRPGRISVERFVEVTSTNPAKLFGLYPRKGTIAVGADADLVVWDPEAERVIDGASMLGNADYSVYDGWEVTGWPQYTILRGEVMAEGQTIVGSANQARSVPRGPYRAL
ncbi:MAG: amidohydrolase family protein [Actinomycetia bacterium]|nr:amidohydrolase family protein [Actinomycetes bacterium]